MWVFFGIGSANCEAYAILDVQVFVCFFFFFLCCVLLYMLLIISITSPPLKLHNQKQKQL